MKRTVLKGKPRQTRRNKVPRDETPRAYQRIIWPWELYSWSDNLNKLSQRINSMAEFDSLMTQLRIRGVKPRSVSGLFDEYHEQPYARPRDIILTKVIPAMMNAVTTAPKLFSGTEIPTLTPAFQGNLILTKAQAASVIALTFFGLLAHDYVAEGPVAMEDFSEPGFGGIFETKNVFGLACLVEYFLLQASRGAPAPIRRRARGRGTADSDRDHSSPSSDPSAVIIRRATAAVPDVTALEEEPICEISLGKANFVDAAVEQSHLCFCSEFINADMFSGSLCHDEIMSLVRPECFLACVFCSRLTDSETVIVYGAEKVADRTGYGASIRFQNLTEAIPAPTAVVDGAVVAANSVVFIDASPRTSGRSQFLADFDRDLAKATIGMIASAPPGVSIACGHWVAGHAGSNMQVKFIQQVLAASMAGRPLVYYPFGQEISLGIEALLPALDRMTIADLYLNYLDIIDRSGSNLTNLDVFGCLIDEY